MTMYNGNSIKKQNKEWYDDFVSFAEKAAVTGIMLYGLWALGNVAYENKDKIKDAFKRSGVMEIKKNVDWKAHEIQKGDFLNLYADIAAKKNGGNASEWKEKIVAENGWTFDARGPNYFGWKIKTHDKVKLPY